MEDISQHNELHKAYESLLVNIDCPYGQLKIVRKGMIKVYKDGKVFYIKSPLIEATCDKKQITISWIIPTEKENGSLLTIQEISSYEITLAAEHGTQIIVINNPEKTNHVIYDLKTGSYSGYMKTFTKDGQESERSKTFSFEIK